MRRQLCFGAILLGCVLSGPARAQSRTGRLEGTIYDDEGMPLAGARVSASSPTQIGGRRTTTTGDDGSFRFIGLIPGVFRVSGSKTGFLTAVRQSVRISLDKTITLDILLDRAKAAPPVTPTDKRPKDGRVPVPAKRETYVITTARPVVDVTKATTGESLSDEYLEALPLSSRGYQGVAGLTGGVTIQRDPKGAGAGNPSIAGGAYFNNTYLVDGMDTTDPVTHTFSTNFNFDAMSDVNIVTGGAGPEYSDTPGGVINMVTKSGSNKLELDASIYYQDDALTIKREEELGSTFRNLDVNINVGGPIIRDRLWYFTSFELNEATGTIPPDPNGLLPHHPSRRYLGIKWLGKLTFQVNPKNKLILWAQTSPASISNTRQLITVEPDAEAHQNQYNVLSTLAWESIPTDNLFLKTGLGFGWNGLRIYPQSGVEDVASINDVGSGVSRRNYGSTTSDDRYRISLNADATYFHKGKLGEHEIKGGFRFQHLINPSSERITGNQVFTENFGQPASLTRYFLTFDQLSACDPNSDKYDPTKCRQGSLDTSVSGNKLIGFLQDRWRLPGYKRLSLIPGVAFHFGESKNPDGETVTSFVTATAHLNFAWDVLGDGKTVVRGGYNQYVDMGFLSIPRFIGRDMISYRCNYDPNTGTYSTNCQVGGQIRTVGKPMGPGFDAEGKPLDKFNPDALTVPRVHEITFGAEREWLQGFSTGLDFQYRRYNNQWEDLETNVIWNEVGDNAQGFRNGKSEFIYDLETPKEAYRRYVGLTFFARKFIGDWQLMASYTWSRYEGTVAEGFATVYLDRARQAKFFEGFLPDDRRHVLKVAGWYRWRSLTVGGSLWIGTGTPYDRLYFNSFFNDYEDRRAQRGFDPRDLTTPKDDQELRTPTRVELNLKVTYRLDQVTKWLLGSEQKLELIGEVFNLVNLRTPTRFEERNLAAGAATSWGDILDRQSPFRVRFGLRYRY
jgi:hypothetical protein